MSRRTPELRLRHMRDHGREALTLIAGRSREDLEHDRLLQLALVRLLEIIGEAAARTPEVTRAENPHIAWAQIVGLRNRLIHGYDSIDLDIVWTVLNQDLPRLTAQLEAILTSDV